MDDLKAENEALKERADAQNKQIWLLITIMFIVLLLLGLFGLWLLQAKFRAASFRGLKPRISRMDFKAALERGSSHFRAHQVKCFCKFTMNGSN